MEAGFHNTASTSTLSSPETDSSPQSSPTLLQLSEIFEENNNSQSSSLPPSDRFESIQELSVPETVRFIAFGDASLFERFHWKREFEAIRQNLLVNAKKHFPHGSIEEV